MKQNRVFKGFIVLVCIIYIAFTTIDSVSGDPTWIHISAALKLMSIGLCLAYLVHIAYTNLANNDSKLMVLIMSLTLASDVFLLLTRQFIYGLVLFVLVQILYEIRIQKGVQLIGVLIKGFVFVACLIFFMILLPQSFSYALMLSLGAFYAILFACNIIRLAIVALKRTDIAETVYDSRLFIIGLILYAICDINVAIYNFPSLFDSNVVLIWLYKNASIAMWLFYLPGQVALTLSVRRKVDGKSR